MAYENLSKEELLSILRDREGQTSKTVAKTPETLVNSVCRYVPVRKPNEPCTAKATTDWGFCSKHSRTVQAKKARQEYETTVAAELPTERSEPNEVSEVREGGEGGSEEVTDPNEVSEVRQGGRPKTRPTAATGGRDRPQARGEGRRGPKARSTAGRPKARSQAGKRSRTASPPAQDLNPIDKELEKIEDSLRSNTKRQTPKSGRKSASRGGYATTGFSYGDDRTLSSPIKQASSKPVKKRSTGAKTTKTVVRRGGKMIPKVIISKNFWGRYEDKDTRMVFNPDTQSAYGVQLVNGKVGALKDEHIAVCKKRGWKYSIKTAGRFSESTDDEDDSDEESEDDDLVDDEEDDDVEDDESEDEDDDELAEDEDSEDEDEDDSDEYESDVATAGSDATIGSEATEASEASDDEDEYDSEYDDTTAGSDSDEYEYDSE